MAFYEYYVDSELKELTSAYSFPPCGEVVLLSLKSTCEGNEVAMDKILAICREILDHMPRNPGPPAKNANKSSAICQDCQGPSAENAINPQPSAEIAKNAESALAAGSFGSLGSR